MEEYIKQLDGKIIGIVETDNKGNKTVREFASRKVLGYYYRDRNVTTDFFGRIISQGDTSVSLLYK